MKIAWFTPFSQRSAIGKISRLICEEIAQLHSVDIWAPADGSRIETKLRVVDISDKTLPELSGYDQLIYNMGNYAGFHREIYDVMQRYPGIVILHDQLMSGFWEQYLCVPEYGGDIENGRNRYFSLMEAEYGRAGRNAADRAAEAGIYPWFSVSPEMEGYSFLEPTIRGAQGVFTHSHSMAEKVSMITNAPVDWAYLPCTLPEGEGAADGGRVEQIVAKARCEGRKIIVTTGIVHPGKRIDRVTEVLEDNPELAEKICYIVIGEGSGEYWDALQSQERGALSGCLHLTGYGSEAEMQYALSSADMTSNLRYPNSEVCSLSLWEQMAWGKPVLTLNSGIYAEVPPNAVIRISLQEEKQEIRMVLRKLVSDELDPQIGENARGFISEKCSMKAYTEKLLYFAQRNKREYEKTAMQNRIIDSVAAKMARLECTEKMAPTTYSHVIKRLDALLGGGKPAVYGKTLGIWAAFPYEVPHLEREGISRLMGYLASNLLRHYPEAEIEVWYYTFNEEGIRKTFSAVREEDAARLHLLNETNWKDRATAAERGRVGETGAEEDTLIRAVRAVSRADVFVPLILYLDRILECEKPVFIPAYDMATVCRPEYENSDNLYTDALSYIWKMTNAASYGAEFYCNSDTVRREEILRYTPGLSERRTHVIYVPHNMPDIRPEELLSERELRERFQITGEYLFYPTQIRPYKNVALLVRAMAELREEYPELKLVLTGSPKDVPAVEEAVSETGIGESLILTRNVSERELYSLYRCAACVPSVSVMEGGFPYQALEGMSMGCPVVLADIPVVRERIEELGYTAESSGLSLFAPDSKDDLVKALKTVLADRQAAAEQQKEFASRILSYDWEKAIQQYYELFFNGRTENAR